MKRKKNIVVRQNLYKKVVVGGVCVVIIHQMFIPLPKYQMEIKRNQRLVRKRHELEWM